MMDYKRRPRYTVTVRFKSGHQPLNFEYDVLSEARSACAGIKFAWEVEDDGETDIDTVILYGLDDVVMEKWTNPVQSR